MEMATNKENVDYAAFIDTADRIINFSVKLPDSWDRGNIHFKFYWTVSAAPTSGTTVMWGVKVCARGDNEAIDLAYGAETTQSDTYQTANYLHISDACRILAANIGGATLSIGDLLTFSVRRVTASDDAAASALLLGVALQFNNSGNPGTWVV